MNMANSSADVIRALLDGGADQHLTTDDRTTPPANRDVPWRG